MKINLTKNKKILVGVISTLLIIGLIGSGVYVYNQKEKSKYILSESISFDKKAQSFLDVQTRLQDSLNEVENSKDENLLSQVKEEVSTFTDEITSFENDAKHSTEVNTSKASVYSEMLAKAKELQPQMMDKVLNIEKAIADEKAAAKAKAEAEAAQAQAVTANASVADTQNGSSTINDSLTPANNAGVVNSGQQTPSRKPTASGSGGNTTKKPVPSNGSPAKKPTPSTGGSTNKQPAVDESKMCERRWELNGHTNILTYPCYLE